MKQLRFLVALALLMSVAGLIDAAGAAAGSSGSRTARAAAESKEAASALSFTGGGPESEEDPFAEVGDLSEGSAGVGGLLNLGGDSDDENNGEGDGSPSAAAAVVPTASASALMRPSVGGAAGAVGSLSQAEGRAEALKLAGKPTMVSGRPWFGARPLTALRNLFVDRLAQGQIRAAEGILSVIKEDPNTAGPNGLASTLQKRLDAARAAAAAGPLGGGSGRSFGSASLGSASGEGSSSPAAITSNANYKTVMEFVERGTQLNRSEKSKLFSAIGHLARTDIAVRVFALLNSNAVKLGLSSENIESAKNMLFPDETAATGPTFSFPASAASGTGFTFGAPASSSLSSDTEGAAAAAAGAGSEGQSQSTAAAPAKAIYPDM